MTDATPVPLLAPREGVPQVVTDPSELVRVAQALQTGQGPVAVDAERASGYRYGQSAYLVQLRRAGSGTWLIDPVPCPDLSVIGSALQDVEWVLHAASQDLGCLAELGMRPSRLFDTELAARLAGLPRVGLGAVIEQLLGLVLTKEHSAVDWSTRPLPEPWLRYAALDVEVLVELRDALAALLDQQGKLAWALEEFAAIAAARPPAPRVDPWRRTAGIHQLRQRRQLAGVRELWLARDALARQRDTAPGRVLSDAAIVQAVTHWPESIEALLALATFRGPAARRTASTWLRALQQAAELAQDDLPPLTLASDAPPPPRAWAERDPDAAARLVLARHRLGELSVNLNLPVENLMTPDVVRRVLWRPPPPEDIEGQLQSYGARPWQVQLVAPVLRAALSQTAATGAERLAEAAALPPPEPATGTPSDPPAQEPDEWHPDPPAEGAFQRP